MKTKLIFTMLLSSFCIWNVQAQHYTDYLGAGHNQGITVTSSSDFENSIAANTIDGGGMDAAYMEIARFLSQTSFGGNMEEIERTHQMGMQAWMDEQFSSQASYLLPEIDPIWETIKTNYQDAFEIRLAEGILELCEINPDTSFTAGEIAAFQEEYFANLFGPYALHFNYAWWHNMMTAEDQLRQRVAYALSQILVVSGQSDLGSHAHSMAGYYDLLIKHAFGNYKDLLMDVTLSPAMGYYLSHLNNPRAIDEFNIHPDENYAREIMQLFTIGLYMLNPDGTRMKDSDGNDIPTYDNSDIKELAKVFTGLGFAELDPNMEVWWLDEAVFGEVDLYIGHKWFPMKMYQEWHEPAEKIILKDLVIPAGQPGMQDIEMAVDYLFNHPNVGPFISKLLIQRLVKSNPSPEYISRVAAVFNNNGQGVRGDMRALTEAIIMDEEARTCAGQMDPGNGMLREPTLRHSLYSRAIPMTGIRPVYHVEINSYDCNGIEYEEDYEEVTEDIRFWHNGYSNFQLLRQSPLLSPTVFNFYLPDHQPVGEMTQLGLFGPEFKIHDSGTSINYLNMVLAGTFSEFNMYSYDYQNGIEYISPDYTSLEPIASEELEALLNYYDIVFMHGEMSDMTRENLRTMIDTLSLFGEPNISSRILMYFILISPDFTILK